MNKTELIDAVALNSGLAKVDVKKATDGFIEVIFNALQNDDRIALVGFGSFSVSDRKIRKGVNPQTGKDIIIPAKKIVKFKAGSDLSSQIQ